MYQHVSTIWSGMKFLIIHHLESLHRGAEDQWISSDVGANYYKLNGENCTPTFANLTHGRPDTQKFTPDLMLIFRKEHPETAIQNLLLGAGTSPPLLVDVRLKSLVYAYPSPMDMQEGEDQVISVYATSCIMKSATRRRAGTGPRSEPFRLVLGTWVV